MTEWDDMKDITADIEISTDDIIDEDGIPNESMSESVPDSVPDSADLFPDEDHPGLALLDIAIDESVRYCKKENLPAPNLALWENFSRSMLNRALWHYFPSGDAPDSPALCLIIGVGGLSLCYAPVIMSYYEKAKSKDAPQQPDKRPVSASSEKVESDIPRRSIRPKERPQEPQGDASKVEPKLASRLLHMESEAGLPGM